MRPEAAEFSPRGSTYSDGSFAVIPHASAHRDGHKTTLPPFQHLFLDDTTSTHQGFPAHDSIKELLDEVKKLNLRCQSVEATHADLKNALAALQHGSTPTSPAADGHGNLTGYSSSECSTEDDRGRSLVRKTTDNFETNILHNMKVFQEVLQGFDDDVKRLQDYVKAVDGRSKDSQDNIALIDRITAVEEGLKSLTVGREIPTPHASSRLGAESLASSNGKKDAENTQTKSEAADESKPSSKNGDPYGMDRVDETGDCDFEVSASTKRDMAMFWADEVKKLKHWIKMVHMGSQKAVGELSDQVKALGAVVEAGGGESKISNWESDSSNGKPAKASKQDVVDLKQWQGRMLQQAKNAQLIDEASQRDILYAMFFQLSAIMERGDGSTFWMEGPFEATSEEAFSLRDRVLCRLALFDRYAEVLEEAQAQKDKIDW